MTVEERCKRANAVSNRYQVEKLFTKKRFSSKGKSPSEKQPTILSCFRNGENSCENEEKMIVMSF